MLEKWLGRRLDRTPRIFRGFEGMSDYAKRAILPHISNREAFEFCIEATVEAAHHDGIYLLEASVDCRMVKYYPNKEDGLADFLRRIIWKWAPLITFRPELGVSRACEWNDVSSAANACLDTKIFSSVDLYGPETLDDDKYKLFYYKAKNCGLKTKAHIGEWAKPSKIVDCVNLLGLDEVQHGVTAARCQSTLAWLAKEHVRLNLAPASNVRLGAVDHSYATYPIRKFLDAGVRISIGTDDLLFFDRSVKNIVLDLVEAGCISVSEGLQIGRGFEKI